MSIATMHNEGQGRA